MVYSNMQVLDLFIITPIFFHFLVNNLAHPPLNCFINLLDAQLPFTDVVSTFSYMGNSKRKMGNSCYFLDCCQGNIFCIFFSIFPLFIGNIFLYEVNTNKWNVASIVLYTTDVFAHSLSFQVFCPILFLSFNYVWFVFFWKIRSLASLFNQN